MAWVILAIAGLFETGWAVGLKYSAGFTRPWATVWTVVSMIVSLGLLGIALKHLPVGSAYAVWVGIGAVGTAAYGMLFLGEDRSLARMACFGLIFMGIVGLKFLTLRGE